MDHVPSPVSGTERCLSCFFLNVGKKLLKGSDRGVYNRLSNSSVVSNRVVSEYSTGVTSRPTGCHVDVYAPGVRSRRTPVPSRLDVTNVNL